MLIAESRAAGRAARTAVVITPYRKEHEPAVQAFNERLKASQPDQNLVFYSASVPRWLPPSPGSVIHNEYFVAVDGGEVRGAYALKWQTFRFPDNRLRAIACYHHPLSEGVIDRTYAQVGGLLVRDALGRSPLLYSLGMGGYERPLPRMLIALGWSHRLIPFRFRVVHPFRFLREMQAARSTGVRRALMDAAAFTGAGWVAARTWHALARIKTLRLRGISVEPVREFDDWADRLWCDASDQYSLTAVRDAPALRRLYPASVEHLVRLRVTRQSEVLGWVVVGERRRDAKYGAMRVGSLIDCWARPGGELAVVRAATGALERMGMDLIVTNQSHPRWHRALDDYGFLRAPSNFIFAASRQLSALLQPFESSLLRTHMTRADGDGLPDNF